MPGGAVRLGVGSSTYSYVCGMECLGKASVYLHLIPVCVLLAGGTQVGKQAYRRLAYAIRKYASLVHTLHARAVAKRNETESEVGGTWDCIITGLYRPRPSRTSHCQWFELFINQLTQPWKEAARVRHGCDGCPKPNCRTCTFSHTAGHAVVPVTSRRQPKRAGRGWDIHANMVGGPTE